MQAQIICYAISVLIAIAIIAEAIFRKKFPHTKPQKEFKDSCINLTFEQLAQRTPLPENFDCKEVEEFLKNSHFTNKVGEGFVFRDGWETSPYVTDANLSENAMKALHCLYSDFEFLFHSYISLSQNEKSFDNYSALQRLLNEKYCFSKEFSADLYYWYRFCDK